MTDLEHLEYIVKETYNTEFRLSFDGKEWKIYIVKTKTLFIGKFEEVLKLAIEEFISYRTISDSNKKKNKKQFTYK